MAGSDPSPSTKVDVPIGRTQVDGRSDKSPTIDYIERAHHEPAVPPERVIGGYELLEEIGRGGMGIVYKARQIELDRTVALKMILGGALSSPEELQRFRIEAEAAGRLQHPNIVQIYEINEVEGRCYYSMEYVPGPGLAEQLANGPMPCKEAARLLATLARAVQHAHQNDILHRDLKPSNILLSPLPAEGEGSGVRGLGVPKITDFGLAKRLHADSIKTRTGAVMGTPSYMPPEQAAGRVHDLGPRSDIYSLGAILYEMLTGRPPFEAESAMDTLRQVVERQPAPPRLLNAKIDRDLETICLKCLEKAPQDRYDSAQALADDLDRYLRGDSINARSFNVLDRLGRTLERDQYLSEFQAWGTMLLVFAVIVLAEHVLVFALTRSGHPRGWVMLARFTQFALMGLIFWRQRRHCLLPTTVAERQLYAIWIGYMLASMMVGTVHHLLAWQGKWGDEFAVYPIWSALTGLAFFAMGSNYWGWFYALGLAFFALAAALTFQLESAVLLYGFCWTAALAIIGCYLRRLGKSK
jgi:serine/threonine protein kinase